MKVLIVGHGYVGSAIGSIFKKEEKTIVDPKYFKTKLSDICKDYFDVVFVCVDTPKDENFKVLNNVLKEINSTFTKGTIVCAKSTASPLFYKESKLKYKNIKLVFYPEYLSHYNNIEDFQNQDFIILGGDIPSCKKIEGILVPRLKNVKYANITDISTAALIKYAENGYLAYKVTFFNELYRIHSKLKIPSSFKNFVKLLVLDKRIGESHTQVPGRDGKKGWGGHCFTKDNHEFYKFTKSSLIKFLIEINKIHRGG